jgi:hypothetical protein
MVGYTALTHYEPPRLDPSTLDRGFAGRRFDRVRGPQNGDQQLESVQRRGHLRAVSFWLEAYLTFSRWNVGFRGGGGLTFERYAGLLLTRCGSRRL